MKRRGPEVLALFALTCAALLFASRPIWNIDLFWHIAAGKHFLTQGTLPVHDIFSAITPERSWVTFQWGYQVLVHGLDSLGGLPLVRVLHIAVIVGALGIMWWGCRRRLAMGPWVSLALTLMVLVLFGDRIRARPHVFNLLGWVIALPWLVRGPRMLDRRACLGIALTVGCWANLHAGGALLFLIAAATLPAGAWIGRWMRAPEGAREAHRATLWYACALLPALLSPLFVRGNLQALTTFAAHEGVIGEWQPSWHFLSFVSVDRLTTSGLAHLLCGLAPTLAGLVLVWMLWRARHAGPARQALPPWRALLVLSLVVLGHRSVRFVYVAAFALVALGPALALLGAHLSVARRRGLVLGGALLLAVSSYGFNISAQHPDLGTAVERAFEGEDIDTRRFPVAAADFLASTGFEGHIFCQTNWGGYLLWRLSPEVRVIADGRANFSADVERDLAYVYDRGNLSEPDAGAKREAIFTRYDVDLIVHQHPVWPEGYTPDTNAFLRVFEDHRGEVWLRNTPRGNRYLEGLKARTRSRP